MEDKVFGVKAIWTPKIFAIAYFVFGVAFVFCLVYSEFVAAGIILAGLLSLRILYEFFMSSFKATEYLYRIAESLEVNDKDATK